MPFGKEHGQQYLDGRHCFDLYLMAGSWRKAAEIIRAELVKAKGSQMPVVPGDDAQRRPSPPGVENAGKKWAALNPEEAFKLVLKYQDRYQEDDLVGDDGKPTRRFYRVLAKYAKGVLNTDDYANLLASEPYASHVHQQQAA